MCTIGFSEALAAEAGHITLTTVVGVVAEEEAGLCVVATVIIAAAQLRT